MAVRNYTLSGITEDGVTQSIVPGYEGLDFFCIKERVVVGSAAVQFTLNQKFPKRAKCMGYAIKCQAAATVTTATHIGIGFGSDVDGISETAIASINGVGEEEIDFAPDTTSGLDNQTADVALTLNALNGSGSAAGTINTGTWDIVIWGYKLSSIETDS